MTAPVQQCQPDIVERLRKKHADFLGEQYETSFWLEAADHIEELTKALIDAKLQIEYVQEKHGYATGEAVLARIRSSLSLEDRK